MGPGSGSQRSSRPPESPRSWWRPQGDPASGGGAPSRAAPGWTSLPPSPLARTEVGTARVGGFIYVVGGFIPPFETTNQVARYEVATGRWTLLASMPVAVNHPAVAAHGGRLYVHGGYRGLGHPGDETDALQRFDPATGAWATLTPSGFPRAAHSLVPVGKRLYAIGGAHSGNVPLALVQVYEPSLDRWTGGPSMTVAREHLASVAIGRRIFVLGGRVRGDNLATVERLDVRTGRWVTLPSLTVPRSGFGAAAVKGRVIAIGGEQLAEGDQTIGPVELYVPARKRWKRLPGMITPRHGVGVTSQGRRVFALEGGPQPGLAFSSAAEMLLMPKLRPPVSSP